MKDRRALVVWAACVVGTGFASADEALPNRLPPGFEAKPVEHVLATPKDRADQVRDDALARADVWSPPAVPPAAADLASNPGPFPDPAVCRFHPSEPSGATPKFDCVFEGGEVLKVKYGRNPEVHSEAVATRLLAALGFGADRMYVVKTLRCFGCRLDPYTAGNKLPGDESRFVDFHNVAVERRLEGKAIEGDGTPGWGWEELEKAQATERGSSRAGATRCASWRCSSTTGTTGRTTSASCACRRATRRSRAAVAARRSRTCTTSAARSAAWERWTASAPRARTSSSWTSRPGAASPSGRDRAACTVSIKAPHLHGATFEETAISESGRRLLSDQLVQITPAQMEGLFAGSLVGEYEEGSPATRDPSRWAAVLQDKVRQITEGAPCPTL